MTPNGAILFGLLVILAAIVAREPISLALLLLIALAFAAIGCGRRTFTALLWSAAIVLPLAAFMGLVWVGIVGRAPAEIAAGTQGSRAAAAAYVLVVCLRLFIIAFVVQAALMRFSDVTPLQFIRQVTAPPLAKKLVVLTLSLIDTTLHAVERARTALIAAGTITRAPSLRNLRNGWILVQTVWLTVITIAIGRVRDKWPAEDTLALLDGALAQTAPRHLNRADWGWIVFAAVGLVTALGLR